MKLFSYDQPLKLPQGSVRALIVLVALIGSFVYLCLWKMLPPFIEFLLIAVVSYYFGTRGSETKGKEREQSLPEAQ